MKYRVLDVMNEALGLVKKSDLTAATALIRKALSGDAAPADEREELARPDRPSAKVIPLPPRRPLGETLRALRVRPSRPPAPAPGLEPAPDLGERFLKRTYRGPAGSLDYRLYLPPDHERRNLALVLMLHGCTQNPEDFALGTRMNALADEFGLIVAYPHQPRRANANGCWNWFDKKHQSRGSGEPAKLAGLAEALAKEFGVGAKRIFAAGLSAGGAMAEVLSATYPDVFAAVGVHSGLPYRSAHDVPSAFAAMNGNGAVDSPGPPTMAAAARSSFTAAPIRRSIRTTANKSWPRPSAAHPGSRGSIAISKPGAGEQGSRRSRTRRAGRSSSAGSSRTAATHGSAAIRVAATRKAPGWTPPASWCASS